MNNNETVFGVNFVDGRIKGYPKYKPQTKADNKMYFRLVRGNTEYGENNFVENNETVSDVATGLEWQKDDSQKGLDWEEALDYCNGLSLNGDADWRLPNAKELQSIVDYSRSPQTTNSAAIDPVFDISQINDPEGAKNYPFFWTSSTHLDGKVPESSAAYVTFGDAQGEMNDKLMDVHGAGAQRSDPKSGDRSDYPSFWGPQGDVRYVYNYVRCVRSMEDIENTEDAVVIEKETGSETKESSMMKFWREFILREDPENKTPKITPTSDAVKGERREVPERKTPKTTSTSDAIKGDTPPAVSVCVGKSLNAACSFSGPRRSVTGVCTQTPRGEVACIEQ